MSLEEGTKLERAGRHSSKSRTAVHAMLSSSKIPASDIFDDDWDSVINYESAAFDNGVDEGRRDAKQSREMYDNGLQSGFLKGGYEFCVDIASTFLSHVTDK